MSSLSRLVPALAVLFLVGGASPPPQPDVSLLYRSHWGGFHTADMVVSARRDGTTYRLVLTFQARGLANLFLGLGLRAESMGRDGAMIAPWDYGYYAHTPKEETRVILVFDAETGLGRRTIAEKRSLPGGGWTPLDDEPLPSGLRSGVLDPLSAFLALGDRARAAVAAGGRTFTVQVFDGRRRYDLAAEVTQGNPTVRLRVAVRPVAGFSRRHLRMWRGTSFEVTLDERLWLPTHIAGNVAGPSLVIRAIRACPPSAGCTLSGRG